MRYLAPVWLAALLLGACAPQDRIYDVWEVDEPPAMVGDSIVIEAPAPPDPHEQAGGH